MTMSDTCATHVLDKGKSESCLVNAPAMHASESVLVVGELLCTGVQANAERHTRNETREMCSCWGYKQHLLRRLHLPLLLAVRKCWCGRPLDACGQHRAACARSGVLAGRGWSVENAAKICREAGGRVTNNVPRPGCGFCLDPTSTIAEGSKWWLTDCPSLGDPRQSTPHCSAH